MDSGVSFTEEERQRNTSIKPAQKSKIITYLLTHHIVKTETQALILLLTGSCVCIGLSTYILYKTSYNPYQDLPESIVTNEPLTSEERMRIEETLNR